MKSLVVFCQGPLRALIHIPDQQMFSILQLTALHYRIKIWKKYLKNFKYKLQTWFRQFDVAWLLVQFAAVSRCRNHCFQYSLNIFSRKRNIKYRLKITLRIQVFIRFYSILNKDAAQPAFYTERLVRPISTKMAETVLRSNQEFPLKRF